MSGCGVCRSKGHTHLTLRRPHHGLLQSANRFVNISVTDPRCLSRILICIHPGCRTLDPTTATKEEGGELVVLPFCSHKYNKIENLTINVPLILIVREVIFLRAKHIIGDFEGCSDFRGGQDLFDPHIVLSAVCKSPLIFVWFSTMLSRWKG